MSDSDIKTLGNSTSSSGFELLAALMKSTSEVQDVYTKLMATRNIHDPMIRLKIMTHFQVAGKLLDEALERQKVDAADGETHLAPHILLCLRRTIWGYTRSLRRWGS